MWFSKSLAGRVLARLALVIDLRAGNFKANCADIAQTPVIA
jgi:hypothetical protein